jgi:Tetracyclin repressor-like, C-terminal domain
MVWRDLVRLCANHHHHRKHPRPSVTLALKGYHLDGADLVHAIRTGRAACHGLASLEMAGGLGLPESVDGVEGRTYLRGFG